MVKISHEIPKALFPYQSLISDYPYALGHLLGKDKEYSEFYKYQFKNSQFGILDNSCLDYYSNILLEDGSTMKLGAIVKQKLPVKILSYNEKTKSIESKLVENWFENGKKKVDWYKIIYSGAKINKTGRVGVRCTGDHKIFTKHRGYVEARDLKEGEELCFKEPLLTRFQKQLLLGSILGDGTFWKTSSTSSTCFRVSHSEKQKTYLLFKLQILKNFLKSGTPYSRANNTMGFNKREGALLLSIETKPIIQLNDIYDEVYKHNPKKKYLSSIIPKLDWFGLMIWILDDGTCNQKSPTLSLALPKLLDEDKNELCGAIKERFDIDCHLSYHSEVYTALIFKKEATEKIFEHTAKYFIPEMRYKLFHKYRTIPIDLSEVFSVSSDVSEVKIEKIISLGTLKKPKYDITVKDNHNYFADGILVSNCFELGKSIDLKDLKDIVKEYKPSHYILPDYLHNQKETLQMSEEFLALYNSQLDSAPIGVVQGKSFNELIQCIQWYLDHHVRFIAIPFDPLPDSEFGITRYFFFKEIFDHYVKKNVGVRWHFLGCQNPSEFQLYSPEMKEFIYSVDTSSPIITGWNSIKYGEFGYSKPKPKEKLADSLDIELSYDQIQDIIYNVKKFKQYWK